MMRTIAIFSLGFIAAIIFGAVAPVGAQPYPPPPGYYPPPPPPPGYYYGRRAWNGCPPNYTIQGGVCKPYQGPVGGGWGTVNGCPPGYTVQGGVCKPYRGGY
jgi:hypothetical protein